MQLKLKVVGGERDGTDIPIPGPKFLIGRDADCNLRPRNEMISRHHCVLIVEQGYVGLRDFNSKNGTFVNGERIRGERELKAGDELEIGNLRFKVNLDYSLGGRKKSKVKDMSDAVARTASRSGNDANIDDWLVDDDSPQNDTLNAAAGKTAKMATDSLSDTAEIRLQDEGTVTQPATVSSDASNPSQDHATEEAGNKAKDTRVAAMDVLRKIRKQQRNKQQNK